jgi:hypothetical protein
MNTVEEIEETARQLSFEEVATGWIDPSAQRKHHNIGDKSAAAK